MDKAWTFRRLEEGWNGDVISVMLVSCWVSQLSGSADVIATTFHSKELSEL